MALNLDLMRKGSPEDSEISWSLRFFVGADHALDHRSRRDQRLPEVAAANIRLNLGMLRARMTVELTNLGCLGADAQ